MWMPIDSRVYDVTLMYNHDLETDKAAWNGIVAGLFIIGGWCLISSIVGLTATGCMNRNALIAMLRDDISTTMGGNLFEYYTDENSTDEFTSAWNRYQVEVRDNSSVSLYVCSINLLLPYLGIN
ncbi:hypothetical protein LSH36_193g11017 [Paralvinella palmiformis]|uniref:Uncharacterized protein n=1 Tax=Paralvinella palmiformis TaxID=53620 RepID=A0AAD9JSH0_9ANNE|nr:hypothetical protein LSH36_193g11017 [Paralvinella palmiformis]